MQCSAVLQFAIKSIGIDLIQIIFVSVNRQELNVQEVTYFIGQTEPKILGLIVHSCSWDKMKLSNLLKGLSEMRINGPDRAVGVKEVSLVWIKTQAYQ